MNTLRFKKIGTVLIIIFLTLIAGELKVIPFEDTTFRFGLGSVVFFLGVIVLKVPPLWTGLLIAISITPFRALITSSDGHFLEQLLIHSPASVFYFVYALFLTFVPIHILKNKPLQITLVIILADFSANICEQLTNELLFQNGHFLVRDFLLLFVIATLRSSLVVGVYSSIILSEQKKQTAQLLSIGSNLYSESLYIKKMMEQIEEITQQSFTLHQQLRKQSSEHSMTSLLIAQNIHEVKKDLERVHAGMHKIVLSKQSNYYNLDSLLALIVEANTRYSEWLNKDIHLTIDAPINFKTKEPFLLLSVINNIVANAIEAINQKGTITVQFIYHKHSTEIYISNDGPIIDQNMLEVIFDAGYTTKFNQDGVASTGIGLNHVKEMCEKINGSIEVVSHPLTTFIVRIPNEHLFHTI